MTKEQSNHDRSWIDHRPDVGRRKFIAVGGGVGATILAGCASEHSPVGSNDDAQTDEPTESSHDGNFRLLISDLPADIGDFDRLDVTLDYARIFDGGGDEAPDEDGSEESDEDEGGESDEQSDGGNETGEPNDAASEAGESPEEPENESETGDEEGEGEEEEDEPENEDEEGDEDEAADGVERERGFYILDLEGATVDLTEVVGDKAVPVFEGELSPGTYQKIELHVSAVEGIVDGEQANVKVPSGKLQITHPFEITADEPVDFVFDINVVKRGQGNDYNLNPVISESGVAGEDVDVEEVDEEKEEEEEDKEDEEENDDEEEEEEDEEDDDNAGENRDNGGDE